MKKINTILLAAVGFWFAAATAQAATVSFLGSQLGGAAWRTASDVKTFQINGSNVYGSQGYALLGGGKGYLASLPAAVTITRLTSISYDGADGYLNIDDPIEAGTVRSGVWINFNTVADTYDDFLSLDFQDAANYTVGVFTNNTDFAAVSPATLRIAQTSGVGSADSGIVSNTPSTTGAWFFFNVAGVAGDKFTVSGAKAAGFPFNGIAAISLDAPIAVVAGVPEPATWGLMIAGFGLVGAVARRRRLMIVAA